LGLGWVVFFFLGDRLIPFSHLLPIIPQSLMTFDWPRARSPQPARGDGGAQGLGRGNSGTWRAAGRGAGP